MALYTNIPKGGTPWEEGGEAGGGAGAGNGFLVCGSGAAVPLLTDQASAVVAFTPPLAAAAFWWRRGGCPLSRIGEI